MMEELNVWSIRQSFKSPFDRCIAAFVTEILTCLEVQERKNPRSTAFSGLNSGSDGPFITVIIRSREATGCSKYLGSFGWKLFHFIECTQAAKILWTAVLLKHGMFHDLRMLQKFSFFSLPKTSNSYNSLQSAYLQTYFTFGWFSNFNLSLYF
jgi:hypothetical protein